GARDDEFFHDVFRDFDSILRLKVLREHGARKIDRENDVDSLTRDVLGTCARTRSRECDDAAREKEIAKHEEKDRHAAAGMWSTGEDWNAREDNRGRPMPATPDPPDGQQKEKQQRPWRDELQAGEKRHAALSTGACGRVAACSWPTIARASRPIS